MLMLPHLMDQAQRKLSAVAMAIKMAAQGEGVLSVSLPIQLSALRNLYTFSPAK